MNKTAQLIARIREVQLRGNTAPENIGLLDEIIEHLQELTKPHAIYSHHVGGNYGSPLYVCSECAADSLVDEMGSVPIIDQIKHKDFCSISSEKDDDL